MPPKSSALKKAPAEAGSRTRGIDRAFEILDHLHEAKRPLRPRFSLRASSSVTIVLLVRSVTVPPGGVASRAFSTRLMITCSSWP